MAEGADVVVVGAGLSGLAAARALGTTGAAVTIVEARQRIGGRVWSVAGPGGAIIDRGAQWIGPGQTRIAALAAELGLATVRTHIAGDSVVDDDGTVRRLASFDAALPWLARVDSALAWLRLGWASRGLGGEPAAVLDRVGAADWLASFAWRRDSARLMTAVVEAGLCDELDGVSALEIADQLASVGGPLRLATAEQSFLPGGAALLAEGLARLGRATIRLGTPAIAIRQQPAGVTVVTPDGEIAAAAAVVALPPQLVALLALDPPLSDQGRAMRLRMCRGRIVKVQLAYRDPWWRARGLSGLVSVPAGPFTTVIDASPGSTPGVLVGLATGPGADALAGLDEAACGAALAAVVERTLGPAPVAPIAAFATDWGADPLADGGYASRPRIGDRTAAPALAAPHGRIAFAGTETAQRWRSYMEGALDAGHRAAMETLRLIGPAVVPSASGTDMA